MKDLVNKKRAQGFTIIEILIVLAIAGLIIAIVFLAVPQLQRNARDNKRQAMANRISTELGSFAGNNQGKYPFAGVDATYQTCNVSAAAASQTCMDWFFRYIRNKADIADPSTGTDYTIKYTTTVAVEAPPATWTANRAWIIAGAKCNGESPTAGPAAGSATSKNFAFIVSLERDNTYYCIDNG